MYKYVYFNIPSVEPSPLICFVWVAREAKSFTGFFVSEGCKKGVSENGDFSK